MGEQQIIGGTDPEHMRRFVKSVLADLDALERMLDEGLIETGVRRVGAEQEFVLADASWRPAPVGIEVLDQLDDPQFTTELARFNVEYNMPPLPLEAGCLRAMEEKLHAAVDRVREACREVGARVVLTGILPTMQTGDVTEKNITPRARYYALIESLRRLRGGRYQAHFSGADELFIQHDSVMLEACNTSAQFHFQVGPGEFAKLYNAAMAAAGPVLAAATNSPILFGKRLWRETRIALFQQAADTRHVGEVVEERQPRVRFGNRWVRDSVVELFREDISRYRVVVAMEAEEDAMEILRRGGIPKLRALQTHNSTVYRWIRPCYGVCDGVAHLRIENRILPSGPTVHDEVASAALWFGLISGIVDAYGDVTESLTFDAAMGNFLGAARLGLDAHMEWVDGRRCTARDLLLKELIPLARRGLSSSGLVGDEIDAYLGTIEKRVDSGQTGADWMLRSIAAMGDAPVPAKLAAITTGMWTRERERKPVHEWSLARIDEAGGWNRSFRRVEQFMTRHVYTVHQDEVIDLAASLMDWEHIRHVPVEDDDGKLVGLVSYRQLLRFLSKDLPHGKSDPVAARDVMQPDPVTIPPETPTLEAMQLMRERHVSCLPVVHEGRIVGIISDRDFLAIAAELLEEHLREP